MTFLTSNARLATKLGKLIDDACCDENSELPYAGIVVIKRTDSGTVESISQVSGARPQAKQKDQSGDVVLWLASCTKLVTSIACMQLVEQGKLGLDDADHVEELCPELKGIGVIENDGSLVNNKRRITLRMLLTHTAGFGYSFLNPKLEKYRLENRGEKTNYDEFSGSFSDFQQPLVNQPGEKFEYGISLDWAGVLVERSSGLKLNDFMQQHIFQPLGIHEVTMLPSQKMKDKLVGMWKRDSNGRVSRRTLPLEQPLSQNPTELEGMFHSGGAGLFGSIQEYSKILATLLNDGVSPQTGARILSTTTVDQMFTNQLPDTPNFARRHLPAVKPELVYPAEGLYPFCPPSLPQGWGLASMISPGMTGRSETTAHWTGLSNVFWWLDREQGVGGVVGSQILPFADPKAVMLWVDVEGTVYGALEEQIRS